jgi:hypothetical protein
MPDWLKALLDLTIRLVACVGVSWYAWRAGGGWPYGAITLVFSSLVWAVLFAGPIVRGIGRYIWWARKEPYIPWEGRYYEFQNVHVRIYEEDGKLWFVANDVRNARRANLSPALATPKPENSCSGLSAKSSRPITRPRKYAHLQAKLTEKPHQWLSFRHRYFERIASN